MRHTARP